MQNPGIYSKSSAALTLAAALMVGTLADAGLAETGGPEPKISDDHPITISGTATMVGPWTCAGDAKIEAQQSQSADPVPGLAAGIQTVTVSTFVPGIDCGDATMNKHLRRALKEEEFPEVRYRALKYSLIDNGAAVQTSGELTIAGVTRPVAFGAKLTPLPEGGTRVFGRVQINMRDFGVKPPSVFFGALKVADVVTINFNASVKLPQELTRALFPNMFSSK